jgi:hypothetical protein
MMWTPWRTLALGCTLAVAIGAAAPGPRADAQSSPSGATGSMGGTSCPSSNPPNELVLVSGTPQTAELNTAFANPLQLELANANGCPITATVAGIPVTFTAPASSGSATFAASGANTLTVGTDAVGSASVQMFTANDTPGDYTVTASCAYGSVSFALTNSAAGIPFTITPLAPTGQHTTVNIHYSQPLAVHVLDANGNPVVGENVTFSLGSAGSASGGGGDAAAAAGASFDDGTSQTTEATNADGVATSPGLRANATSGTFTATATVAHVTEPARFALENRAARPRTITPVGYGSATATIATRYARRLRATVRTAAGTPVAGVPVTFTVGSASAPAESGGAGAAFTGGSAQATATTGADGIATSPRLTANDQAGRITATATASQTSGMALFHLHNRAGAPSTVTAGIGASQSTATDTRFAIALAVTVTDTSGNKVPDAAVTFTAPSFGAGGSFPGAETVVSVKTNGSGVAVAPRFTANGQAGGYIVTATARNVHPVAFALVNTAA